MYSISTELFDRQYVNGRPPTENESDLLDVPVPW